MDLAAISGMVWGILSIVAQAMVVFGVIVLVSPAVRASAPAQLFARKGGVVAFVATALCVVGSLVYSDVIGYDPCKLCWIQRVFIYPTAVILGIALWKRDAGVRLYAITLASIGGIVAAYHYVSQLGWNPLNLECAVVGYSESCAKVFAMEFGYITIPVMALSACALIIVSLLLNRPWPIR